MLLKDPMHALPVELMRKILVLIEPKQIFALRRLSKRYNAFLQDDLLIRFILDSHDTHDPADAAPRDLTARLTALKSHTTGKPAGHFTHVGHSKISSPVLSGNRLAYFSGSQQLTVINLQTRMCDTWSLGSSKRDCLVMTDQIVAYADSDVHYFRLDRPSEMRMQVLPQGMEVLQLAAHGHHLAILYERQQYGQREVMILDTATGDAVVNESACTEYKPALLLTPNCCVAADFEIEDYGLCPGMIDERTWINYSRFDLDNYRITGRSRDGELDADGLHFDEVSILPTGSGGWYVVGKDCDNVSREKILAVLTETSARPSVEKDATRWKGNSYVGKEDSIIVRGKGVLRGRQVGERNRLLVNDSYLIDLVGDSFEVFSFDGEGEPLAEAPGKGWYWEASE